MATDLIVVENISDWKPEYQGSTVITARDYISEKTFLTKKPIRIINLCRYYKYLSIGYYCSLLAEARGHKVMPAVKAMLELDNRSLYQHGIAELEHQARRELAAYPACAAGTERELRIYFGEPDDPLLKTLASKVFEQYRCPLIRVKLQYQRVWRIISIKPQSINAIRLDERELFIRALNVYTKQRWIAPKAKRVERYDLAILHNPLETMPPSDNKALEKFIRVGKSMDIHVELIQKKDYGRLYEFDALFIRETTGIDHHTFRFAKKADREGMVVIDDPDSIFRCTNKVYLAELLKMNKIRTPKTVICDYHRINTAIDEISYPMVLKIPDGSFSRGVHKVHNRKELEHICAQLLKESDVILAQEYIYTEFDWRIGIINNTPIYGCKYFMSKKHWQVAHYGNNGKVREGVHATYPIAEVPELVVNTALAATRLIGNGFYGVDLKQRGDDVYVIEVNDNPSIDSGVEDEVLKDELYRVLLNEFIQRLNHKWANGSR